MQRRYLIIVIAVVALLVVIGVPAFLLLNGSSKAPVGPVGSTTPTIAASGPTQTLVAKTGTPGQAAALSGEGGDTVITLKWLPVTGAASYNVYRDGSTTPLNADPLTDTQYQDVGLTNTRTYTYTIAPVDTAGKVGTPLPAIKVTAGQK